MDDSDNSALIPLRLHVKEFHDYNKLLYTKGLIRPEDVDQLCNMIPTFLTVEDSAAISDVANKRAALEECGIAASKVISNYLGCTSTTFYSSTWDVVNGDHILKLSKKIKRKNKEKRIMIRSIKEIVKQHLYKGIPHQWTEVLTAGAALTVPTVPPMAAENSRPIPSPNRASVLRNGNSVPLVEGFRMSDVGERSQLPPLHHDSLQSSILPVDANFPLGNMTYDLIQPNIIGPIIVPPDELENLSKSAAPELPPTEFNVLRPALQETEEDRVLLSVQPLTKQQPTLNLPIIQEEFRFSQSRLNVQEARLIASPIPPISTPNIEAPLPATTSLIDSSNLISRALSEQDHPQIPMGIVSEEFRFSQSRLNVQEARLIASPILPISTPNINAPIPTTTSLVDNTNLISRALTEEHHPQLPMRIDAPNIPQVNGLAPNISGSPHQVGVDGSILSDDRIDLIPIDSPPKRANQPRRLAIDSQTKLAQYAQRAVELLNRGSSIINRSVIKETLDKLNTIKTMSVHQFMSLPSVSRASKPNSGQVLYNMFKRHLITNEDNICEVDSTVNRGQLLLTTSANGISTIDNPPLPPPHNVPTPQVVSVDQSRGNVLLNTVDALQGALLQPPRGSPVVPEIELPVPTSVEKTVQNVELTTPITPRVFTTEPWFLPPAVPLHIETAVAEITLPILTEMAPNLELTTPMIPSVITAEPAFITPNIAPNIGIGETPNGNVNAALRVLGINQATKTPYTTSAVGAQAQSTPILGQNMPQLQLDEPSIHSVSTSYVNGNVMVPPEGREQYMLNNDNAGIPQQEPQEGSKGINDNPRYQGTNPEWKKPLYTLNRMREYWIATGEEVTMWDLLGDAPKCDYIRLLSSAIKLNSYGEILIEQKNGKLHFRPMPQSVIDRLKEQGDLPVSPIFSVSP